MYLERDNDIDRLESLFIYTHLYLQALIQVPSVTIQWNPGSFRWIPVPFHWIPVDSCGFLWNPVELMHSCRNLWGIKKYSKSLADPCVHSRTIEGVQTITSTYIDDIFSASSTKEGVEREKEETEGCFEIKDVRDPSYI